MGRYRTDSPLNDRRVREVVGGVVFARLAQVLGVWGPSALESAFLRARDAQQADSASSLDPTNQFAHLLQGRIPEPLSLAAMERVVRQPRGTLQSVPDDVLWTLLQPHDVSARDVSRALDSLQGQARDAIFEEAGARAPGRGALVGTVTVDVLDWLVKIGDHEALIALVALARQFRTWKVLRETELAGVRSRTLFPAVISRQPDLYFRWRHLALLFLQRVWLPQPSGYSVPTLGNKWGQLEQDMVRAAAQAREQGVPLPSDDVVATPRNWEAICDLAKTGKLTIPALDK